jgi:putative flippase GtrA
MVLVIFKDRALLGQLMRFGIFGFLGVVINYSIFAALYRFLHANYVFASVSGFAIGLIFSFFMHKNYTFRVNKGNNYHFFRNYILLNVICILIGMCILTFLVEVIKLNVYLANVIVIGVSAMSQFIGNKFFVFVAKGGEAA